jgi:hypothetical protein
MNAPKAPGGDPGSDDDDGGDEIRQPPPDVVTQPTHSPSEPSPPEIVQPPMPGPDPGVGPQGQPSTVGLGDR